MPSVAREGGKTAPKKPKTKRETPETPENSKVVSVKDLQLPTEMSEPITDLGQATILIYGERKIGKTALTSMFPGALHLLFEPGGKGLRLSPMPMPTWAHFTKTISLLEKTDRYETLIVDTADISHQRCARSVCRKMGVDHPSEGSFGAVWSAIEQEYTDQMNRLMQLGRGVVFTSHASVGKFQKRDGTEYNKLVPSMAGMPRTFLSGVVDCIFYCGYYGEQRYLTIQGSDALEAGHRLKYNFKTVKGQRVHSIPMGESEEEAYANLLKAFRNEQETIGNPGKSTVLSDRKAKMSSKRR